MTSIHSRCSLVLFLLGACSTAPQPRAPQSAVAPLPAEEVHTAPRLDDVVKETEALLVSIENLTDSRREQLNASVQVLMVNCPYTRASMQLPLALEQTAAGIDLQHIDPLFQNEWRTLTRGMHTHVRVLDAIGASLPKPLFGDHLFTALDPASIVDRPALLASADPLAATLPLMKENDSLVGAMSAGTQDLIRLHTDTAYEMMGPTSMYRQLAGWEEALKSMLPHISDPQSKKAVGRMLDALALHASQGC